MRLSHQTYFEAGAVTATPGHFSVQAVFDKLRMDFEPEAFEKGLAFRVHASGFFAYSDAMLVERILRNLTANAIRYTEEGGILVGCRKRGNRLQLEVWDTGIGSPQPTRCACSTGSISSKTPGPSAPRAWAWAWRSSSA